MDEKNFKEKLQQKLDNILKNYNVEVKINKNLIYKVIVNENFEFKPNTPREPKRGSDYAFQTDLLIEDKNNNDLPLVVIKTIICKSRNDPTINDIITYSEKALKHKEIFPYLRYGLVMGGRDDIPTRFFVHNKGFDFAYPLEDINDDDKSIKELAKIIEQQIKSARSLLNVFLKKTDKIKKFNVIVEIK